MNVEILSKSIPRDLVSALSTHCVFRRPPLRRSWWDLSKSFAAAMSVMFELDLHLFGRCKLLSESQRSHAESWNNCTFGQEVFWSNFYLPRGQNNLKSSNCKRHQRNVWWPLKLYWLAPCLHLPWSQKNGMMKKWLIISAALYQMNTFS